MQSKGLLGDFTEGTRGIWGMTAIYLHQSYPLVPHDSLSCASFTRTGEKQGGDCILLLSRLLALHEPSR